MAAKSATAYGIAETLEGGMRTGGNWEALLTLDSPSVSLAYFSHVRRCLLCGGACVIFLTFHPTYARLQDDVQETARKEALKRAHTIQRPTRERGAARTYRVHHDNNARYQAPGGKEREVERLPSLSPFQPDYNHTSPKRRPRFDPPEEKLRSSLLPPSESAPSAFILAWICVLTRGRTRSRSRWLKCRFHLVLWRPSAAYIIRGIGQRGGGVN